MIAHAIALEHSKCLETIRHCSCVKDAVELISIHNLRAQLSAISTMLSSRKGRKKPSKAHCFSTHLSWRYTPGSQHCLSLCHGWQRPQLLERFPGTGSVICDRQESAIQSYTDITSPPFAVVNPKPQGELVG